MTLAQLRAHEQAARARLPPGVVDYYAGGSAGEVSLGEAQQAWAAHRLRPRVLHPAPRPDTALTLLGAPLAAPVLVAPTALHRLAHPSAEAGTAEGTRAAGSLMVVSTRCSLPLEQVAAAAGGPWWFQVYVLADRALTADLVRRARDAGAGALVLTGDTPVVAPRARGATRLGLGYLANLPPGTSAAAAEQDPEAGLEAIDWLAGLTGLPVLVKGVLRADDALACLDAGASGLVVSNHGGRQLDRAVATATALPEVAAAVAGRAPVLVDGGIRSGLDVLTALALGADAVLLGRPVLWALAAGGAEQVGVALSAVGADLATQMRLAGAATLADIGADLVAGRQEGSPR